VRQADFVLSQDIIHDFQILLFWIETHIMRIYLFFGLRGRRLNKSSFLLSIPLESVCPDSLLSFHVFSFGYLDTHLCIRNMGGLVFLDANSTPDSPQPKLYDIAELSRDDFGDRPVMDVRFHTSSDAVVVNDQGSLFAARLGESDVSM
jgi:hypothetical protein